jgi:apolipoprotein N-acyltransferase
VSEPRPDVGSAVRGAGRWAPFVAAACGGSLYFLGYIGWDVWPCLLVFLVPLWSALERTRAQGLVVSGLVGLAFGLTAYAGGFLWLWHLVDPFLGGRRLVGAALWVAYGVWFALGFAVYAALFHAIRKRGWPLAIAGIPPLLVVEWLQPQLFPLYAGNALVRAPAWIQIADVGGPLLLTTLLGMANLTAFATWAWLRGRRPRPLAIWGAAAAIALATLAYGALRTHALETAISAAPALHVGVVQANLGLLEKSTQSLVTHRRHLEQTRELLRGGDLDLVVWPETAYVRGLRRPLPIAGQLIREDVTVPFLFGGTAIDEAGGRRVKSNSAFLIGADGMIREAYDKNLLIPLAEYAPFAELVPAIASWFPEVQEFRGARDVPPLHLGPWRIAVPICYEAIRPEFVRRMVGEGEPHLLVTLANDAWFGDSQEPWLHLALAQLRAVEHRRFLVRSTNSGVSAVVDPMGRIVARTGLLTRESLRATVAPLVGRTVYGRLGDWPGWLSAALVLLALTRRAPSSAA